MLGTVDVVRLEISLKLEPCFVFLEDEISMRLLLTLISGQNHAPSQDEERSLKDFNPDRLLKLRYSYATAFTLL